MDPNDAFALAAGFESARLWLGVRGLSAALVFLWGGVVIIGEYRLWAQGRAAGDQLGFALGTSLIFVSLFVLFLH